MAELMVGVPPSLQNLNLNPHHFRRGPMYSAYAELREWKLRTKNKRLPITPTRPPPSSSTRRSAVVCRSVSMVFRKEENRRPPPTPRQDFRLPPLATPKLEHTRAMTNTMRGSGSRVFSMQKCYNCLKDLKEYSVAVARSGIDDKGRSSAGRQRRMAESAMSLSWMV